VITENTIIGLVIFAIVQSIILKNLLKEKPMTSTFKLVLISLGYVSLYIGGYLFFDFILDPVLDNLLGVK
jgi:hypothetical protein